MESNYVVPPESVAVVVLEDFRNLLLRSLVTGKYYKSPSSFCDVGGADSIILYVDSPWIQQDDVLDLDLLFQYVEGDYSLPENNPFPEKENFFCR